MCVCPIRYNAVVAASHHCDSGRVSTVGSRDQGRFNSGRIAAALENDVGAHIKLTKDITFTTQNAADVDFGVILGEGYYTIDLNSCKIEYNYKGRGGDLNGSPLATHYAKGLTINGPGTIVGGSYAIE